MLKNLVIIKTIKDIHCNGALDLQEFSPVVHMIGHSVTFDTLSCVNHHQSVQTISKWVWTTRIQSSTSNSINEILVSTLPTFFLFFFIMEKEKKSIPSPLFTIAVIGKVFAILFDVHPYPLRTDIKSLISLTDIQDKFNNSFLIILSSYVHVYISATS